MTKYFHSRLNQLSSPTRSNFRDIFILVINKIIPPLFFMSFMMCISSKLAIIFYYYVILYSFLRKNKRLHLDDNKKCFSHFPDNNVMIRRYQLLYVKPLRTKKQMNNDADKHIISYVQLSCINQVEENYTLLFLFELVM